MLAMTADAGLADAGVRQNTAELAQSLLALALLVLGRGWVQLEAGGLGAGLAWDEDWCFGAEGARLVRGRGGDGHDCC